MKMSQSKRNVPDELQAPNENNTRWLLRRVWDSVNQDNEHFMAVIVGQEGSGKSYTALKIASLLDPTFTADRVIFEVSDLLKVLKEGDHEPGNFYVLDEAGVQLGVRTWQERAQVLANQALQLIRSHNLGLLFTVPALSDLDSQSEKRIQALLNMKAKDPGEDVTLTWKWLDIDRESREGKTYKKYPRRRDGRFIQRIKTYKFAPPDQRIVEPYEEAKTKFQNQMYGNTIQELDEDDEEPDKDGGQTVQDIVAAIKRDGVAKVKSTNNHTGEKYIDRDLIRMEYDTTYSESRTVKKLLERDQEDKTGGSE